MISGGFVIDPILEFVPVFGHMPIYRQRSRHFLGIILSTGRSMPGAGFLVFAFGIEA